MRKNRSEYLSKIESDLEFEKRQVREENNERTIRKSFVILSIFAIIIVILILVNDYGHLPKFSEIFPRFYSILKDSIPRR